MEQTLYRLLNEQKETTIELRGKKVKLVLLTALELMEIRFAGKDEEDPFVRALQSNAALTAKALKEGQEQIFADAQEVLETLSVEEINAVVAAYRRWSDKIDPGFDCGEQTVEELKKV